MSALEGFCLSLLGLTGVVVLFVVADRLLMLGARECEGRVVSHGTRKASAGPPSYTPFTEHHATVSYRDHLGRQRTFTTTGPPANWATGESVRVRHRRHWPQLPRVTNGSGRCSGGPGSG